MHQYFISYATSGPLPGQFGFGNAEVLLANPIRSMNEVDEAREAILAGKPRGMDLTILSFRKFDQ